MKDLKHPTCAPLSHKVSGAACLLPIPDEGETTTAAYTILHTGGMVLPSFGGDVGLFPGPFLTILVFFHSQVLIWNIVDPQERRA